MRTGKFDVLHNFISPVTGRGFIGTYNYIWIGNKAGIAIPSPALIDVRLDLMNLRKRYNSLVSADFVVGHSNSEIPNAQVLADLEDGFLYTTDGIVSTSPTSPKLPLCYAASTANLIAVYNNGTAGIGATLTGLIGAFTIDDQTPPVDSVILIKDQLLTYQNGIYVLTNAGGVATAYVLTRSESYNQPGEIQPGDIVAVQHGTVNSNTLWAQTQEVNVIGTDAILFILVNPFGILPNKNIWIGNASNRPIPNPRIALNNLPNFSSNVQTDNYGLYNLYTGQLLGISGPSEAAQPTTTRRIDMSNTPNLSVGKIWFGIQNYTPPTITINGIPPYVHVTGSLNWDPLGDLDKSHGVAQEVGLGPMQLFIGSTDSSTLGQIVSVTVLYIDNLPNLTLKRIWRGSLTNRPVESDDLTILEVKVTNIEDVLIPGIEAEIAALEAEIVAIQAEIVELQAQLVALAATIAIVQGQVSILQGQMANLKLNNIPADGDVSFHGYKLTNLANPTNPTDGVNLQTLTGGFIPVGSVIPLSSGGTNANLTASNGGIFYSTATAGAILAGTATANQVLLSGSSAAPSWSTATYPATTTVSQLLYSSSANVVGGITTANNSVLLTNGSGVPSWQSVVPLSSGGTNANLTASNGGIFYSTATAGAILAGTATANQVLLSGSNAAPSWSTATYPTTTTVSQLLYSSATNVVGGITTANNSVLLTNGSGVPAWQTLTSSAVTSLTGTANQITVSSSTGAVTLSLPASVIITTSVTAGNLQLTGNTFQSTNANGTITISPNGTGNIVLLSGTSGFVGINHTSPHSNLHIGNASARMLTLYEHTNDNFQFVGFGIDFQQMVYQVGFPQDSHVFYAGTSTTTKKELMRINGLGNGTTGIVGINQSSPAAALHATGGVQNVASEDSTIRADGSSNATKVEIKNTGASGRVYEIRSTSGGNFEITDRTGTATRVTMTSAGNIGIGGSPTYLLDVLGTTRARKLLGNGGAPTVSLGGAVGGSPGVPSSLIAGSEMAGTVQVFTGSGAGTGVIGTFTIAAMPSSAFSVVFTAAAATTAPIQIWTVATSSTTFTLNTVTALANSTIYKWNFMIQGY